MTPFPKEVLIRFERVRQPVAISGCDELLPIIDRVLAAWPHDAIKAVPLGSRRKKLAVGRDHGIYALLAPWLATPIRHRDPVNAVCDLVVHLVHAFVATNPSSLCLHSAAVRVGSRLVVFPNVYRGGKSLLCAHLAYQGAEIFADDVIPVRGRDNHAFALGIAPRLRLPLPDCISPGFAGFADRSAGPANGRYRYLDLGTDRVVPFGAHAPIGAFVVLDHQRGRAAALRPLAPAEMLRRVIARNFARRQPAPRILERLERLVTAVPCYRLDYDDPATAARLLTARFETWGAREDMNRKSERTATTGEILSWQTVSRSGARRAGPAVIERCVGDELFLVNAHTDSIYHLNSLAAALWRLTNLGLAEDEMITLIQAAFPGVPAARATGDVRALLKSLEAKGLLACG